MLILRSIGTSYRTCSKKSGEPGTPENGSPGDPQGVAPKRATCLRDTNRESSCSALSVDASGHRCGTPFAYQRVGCRPCPIRTTPHLRTVATRRMACEYQARCAHLSRRRPSNTDKNPTDAGALRPFANSPITHGIKRELSDGFHARHPRWQVEDSPPNDSGSIVTTAQNLCP